MKCYPVRVPGCLSVAQNRSSNTPATPARRGLAAGRWHRFILIGLLVALTVLAVPVAAATIDTGSFTSKYTANIHGAATDLTDYQVKFVLYNVTGLDSSENIHLPGIAQPTFNDVRFALSDGTELSYWMETPTGTDNAIFWVKIPSIPAGYANTVPVDIYYGNPTIGSAADGAATFALFDDFEGSSLNTDKWTVSSGTGYSVSDSKLRLTGTTKLQSNTKFSQNASIGFRGNLYQYIQYLGFQDYAITSDYVQFRVINSYQETFYKKINSVATNYALSSLYGYYWNINEYRTGEMTWNSTHITVTDRVNPRYTNEAALSATLPVYVASQISSVGYYSYYDWIFVRQLADSEPVVNEPAGSVVTGTPDLTINSVSSPTPRIANIVTATIVNLGTGDAGAFKANFTLNGTPSTFDITSLAAGSSTTISVTDPIASRVLGDTIPLTITLDTENALAETDETNNTYSTPLTVVRGGSYGSGYYLGGRYYTGYDLETGNFTEGNVTVVSALGSGYQTDGGWYSTTAQWSADTLPVPATATVRSARLYQSYTWSNNDNPGLAVQFNGNTVDQVAFYGDGPIYSPNYNGQAVYDVTPYFNKDGNTALITASAPSGGLYGAVLVVVYEDTSEPYRKIWLDEGCDTLYGATDESHIAYAMFNNVTTAGVSSAKVMTILPSGNDNNQNSIRFDAQSAALIGSGGADPAFRYYDVTDALHDGTNELGVTYDGSYINLAAAILELTYEAPPSASFSANATSGTAPVSVQFTDLSYGATGWQWDFNNDGTIDSTEKNPVYTYTAAGTFTVNLTATNAYGSATESKTAYITVTGAEATSGPVVAFTATPVSGTWPLAVQFTDESAGTITARSWDFGDYSTPSAEQNPLHTYTTAGTYNVTLSATSADGTNTTVKKNLVTVSPVTGSRLLLANTKNGTVSGDLYVGSFQPVPFADQPTSDDVTVRDFDQRFAIPTFTNIQWARLYVNVYSGSGSANWPSRTTISLDGNGDGTYETTLGVENMSMSSYSGDGKVYWLNDHTNRVYSDYETEYDVTSLITSATPSVHVKNEKTGSLYDGRLKAVTLVVAYNDGDTDQVRYFVNHGGDWFNSGSSSTTFGTAGIASGFTNATLSNVGLSSSDATYAFNGVSLAGADPVAPINYYENHTWSVKDAVSTAANSVFQYSYVAPSFKTTLATLAIKYPGTTTIAPVASFSANMTSGTVPFTVAFTDASTNSPTAWSWDFNNDGTVDSTTQNATYTFLSAGTYTVNLTATNTAGSSSSVQADYITAGSGPVGSAPVAAFSADKTTGTYPLTVSFTDASTNTPTSWAWDFGDGNVTNATVRNPVHTYTNAGTYTVNLTATNAAGSDYENKAGHITVTGSASNDLAITGTVDTAPVAAVFAREANTVTVTDITNTGTTAVTNIEVGLYAGDVSSSVPVNTITIASLAGGATTTVSLIDPTIRDLEGGTVTYTAAVDPANLIAETNETNNNQTTASKPVKFNGYKGKGIYWNGGSNITTKHTYDLNGDVLYSTQPATAYKGQGWATRTETWSAGNLPVPSGATIQKVFLYINYNWDQTPAGVPNMTATFNGNTVVLGTPYMDKSNFGSYANYKYGLYPAIDVTTRFVNGGDNTLVMTPGTGNKNALYPSTLVVIYADPTATRKQIFINEECDELGTSPSGYSTTLEEATAYAPFTGLTIDTASVRTATLHSFAGSAGPSEGNLLFNGATVATAAWQGSSSTASARSFDVRSYLTGTGNEAAIQGDTSGGMDALMQILVVEYATTVSAPVSAFTTGTTTGTAPFTVIFTDASTNTPTSWLWDFGDNDATNSTKQNPVHTYQSAGTYTVNLTVTNAAGSDREEKTGYVIVTAAGPGAAPVASFSTNVAAGLAPLSVQFTDSSATNPTAWSWDFNNDGVVDSIEESPTHLFSTAGIYTVNLSVTNASGTTTLTKPNLIAVSSGVDRLATDQSGTVSGDLYVGAYQPVAWSSQSTTPGLKTFAQAYTLPAHTDIQWARLYAVVYAAGTDNRAGEAAVTFDRDGDGTYETALGTETLAIPATGTAEVYRVNDHVTRQYSDYLIWYNVTPYISANTVNAQIVTRNLNSSTFDGRLKTLTLVVAYNDGDSDQVHYWVNDGHDYQVKTDSAVTSAFATGSLAPGWTTAVLTNLGLSSQDAIYSFNSNELARQGSGLPSFATNTWDVKSYLTAGTDTSFTYQHNTSTTYKTILATLTVKYSAAAPVAPVAAFSATPVSGTAPLAVTFTDASTNAPTSWLWDFGDGNVTNATNQNPVHTYIAAGNYSVNLTATNAAGSDSEARTRYITVTASSVTPDKPVASFRANKTEGDQPLAVKFTDASTNTPTSWLWDFGDSGSSTEQNPVHTYIAAGNYSVNLTATNLAGSDSEARTRYITVTASSVTPDKPVASFRANKTEGDQPLVVKFTDASTNTPTSWSWDFGDSGSSAEQNPVHRYTTTGTYTVSLTATNAAGSNQVTRTRYISVIAPVVENNGFVIPEIETTTTGTTQNVTINSTSANVTTTGNVVTINNTASWSSLAITLSGTPETGTGTINGTVETVRAVTEPVTVPLAEVGTPTVQIALDLDAMPNTTAAITQTITKEPDSTAQSSFTLLASADGKQIDDIAYTINIAKTDLKNAGDGGIIQSATLTMTVSPAWVAAQGGFGNIRVLRRADDGTTQILVPVLAGTDASGNYILTVVSPGGLSTFSLASLSPVTSTTTSGSASTSGSSTASASTSAGIETSSADPADSSVISSSSSTAQKAPLDPSAYPWSSHAVNGNTHISQVDIQTTASIPDLFILTTKPDSLPSAIAKPSYPVYEYQKIDLYKATSDDVYQAVIEFTVSKSYLDEQKMTFHDVQLLRYTNKAWEPLPTEYVGVRNGDYVFKATSSGFSYFATALVKNATSVTVTEVTTTVTPGITVTPETTVVTSRKTAVPTIAKTLAAPLETPEAPTTPLPMVIFGIAGIIVLAISVVVIRKWWIRRQNPALFRKY